MTDDIVTRLRVVSAKPKTNYFGDLLENWASEAADEIERLQKDVELLIRSIAPFGELIAVSDACEKIAIASGTPFRHNEYEVLQISRQEWEVVHRNGEFYSFISTGKRFRDAKSARRYINENNSHLNKDSRVVSDD